ncbi:MAG: N-acetylmuramoyl-L-alanine amidase [Acetobacteraceae bacterium]|nr:N-acetylmuramoyl-L-alanine amidase [Acetobacteraceae bacterium]
MRQHLRPGRVVAALAILTLVAWAGLPALCAAQTTAASLATAPTGGALALGSRGPAVASLQQGLAALGFDPGRADGVFGPLTQKAVTAFQTATGLKADGIAGPLTLAALVQATASGTAQPAPVPPPQTPPAQGTAPAAPATPAAAASTAARAAPAGAAAPAVPARAAVAVATPKPLAGKTIVLDPGHGGDSGARGQYSREDTNNLAIARYLRNLLENAGAEVVMTRDGWADVTLPGYPDTLEARVVIAEEAGADAFISIHNDWNPNPSIGGVTTYYYPNDWTSYPLAKAIQAGMVKLTGLRDVGVLAGAFYVLHWTTMPAVLCEVGFLSNQREEYLLTQASFRQAAAQGIYEGICSFFKVPATGGSGSGSGSSGSGSSGSGSSGSGGSAGGAGAPSGFRPKVMAYWAKWGTDPRPWASLDANKKFIDLVVPYWYTALGDGSLRPRETGHAALVKAVHDAGGKVLALINRDRSSYAMLTTASVRARLVRNIETMVKGEGLDGVNIDFEGLKPWHRASLTALVKEISARLKPLGKMVTVSVVAKWSEDESTNDYAAAYDYDALAAASDGIQVMTYDQHGEWSGPGAVAGLPWVKQVLAYALNHCPPNKLWLGLAGYGYDWSSAGTTSLTADEAVKLAQARGATIVWDDVQQEAHFTYVDSRGITHQVWFENSYSCSRKLRLALEKRLAGVALWSLGQEDARFWKVVDELYGPAR